MSDPRQVDQPASRHAAGISQLRRVRRPLALLLQTAVCMSIQWPLQLPVALCAIALSAPGCVFDDDGMAASDDPGEGQPDSDDEDGEQPDPEDPDQPEPAQFQSCTALSFVADEPTGFDHAINDWVIEAGGATHSAQDVVVVGTEAVASLSASFSYGPLAIDIEDELIRGYLDACDGWVTLGEARTDSAGRVAFELDSALPAGVYHVVFEVVGDGTLASAYVWSLPVGTRLAVFDLDGTLTTSETELYTDLLLGDYQPVLYPDAAELTLAHEAIDHIPLYLASRPGILHKHTRAWLDDSGFAHGIVHLAESAQDLVPTDGGVGAYKRDYLLELADAGLSVDDGYGNTATDIFAYLSAELSPEQVWIVGDRAGEEGTNPVTGSWTDRAAEVLASGEVDQPFER